MKAAVVYRKNEIRIAVVPRPRAGEGELVIQVRASGTCATDVKILGGLGADVVIAAVGLPQVIERYLPLVRNGGIFNVFGGTPPGETISVDPRWIHYGEIVLTGTSASSVEQFRRADRFVR